MISSDEKTLIIRKSGDAASAENRRRPSLLFVSGSLQGQEIEVDKEPFSIGSSRSSDLRVPDPAVSRSHCILSSDSAGYVITDDHSTNGTFIRGVRIMRARLPAGVEITIGGTRMIFNPSHIGEEPPLSNAHSFGELKGSSKAMRRIFYLAENYATTDATVMISGETGTGKDVLAEELHKHSMRAEKPFVVIDCASIASDIVESELFGHVKGAFTGAISDRAGSFAFADGGTVFLDEIGELPLNLQPKLLRAIEKREIKPVGGNTFKKVDVRVICATNRNLKEEIASGRFREDLYYRLSVVDIEMPPLRERIEDIPELTAFFAKKLHGEDALSQIFDFENAMAEFKRRDWPGNVRELRNVVDRAFYNIRRPVDLICSLKESELLHSDTGTLQNGAAESENEFGAAKPFKQEKNKVIGDFERNYVRALLDRNGGNISKSAREAGVERAYLHRLMKKYGINA